MNKSKKPVKTVNQQKTVSKSSTIKKNTVKEQNTSKFVLNISHLFFLITIVIIPNLYYKLALDKHLEIRFLGLALFLVILGVLFIINKKNNKITVDLNLYKSPIVLLLGVYFIIVSISYFAATSKSEALYEILKTGLYLILFLYVLQFITKIEKSEEALVTMFIILGVIASLIGIVQLQKAIAEHGFCLKAAYSVLGNSAHKNIFSQTLYITFSFSLYGIYYFKDFRKNISFLTATANITIILLLMTRAVWVAMGVSGIFVIVLFFVLLRKNIPLKNIKKPIISYAAILGISFIIFLLFSTVGNSKEIKKHIAEITQTDQGNALHRIFLWKKSMTLIRNHPIIGVGAGNWKVDILKYDVTKNDKEKMIVPRRTHNDYISVVSETGILGLIAFGGFLLLAFIQSIRLIKDSESEQDKIFSLILFFVISGYMIYSFFDFPKERIEMQIFIHTIIAFTFYKFYKLKKAEKAKNLDKKIKPMVAFIIVFAFIAMIGAIERIQAEVNVNKIYGKYKNTTQYQKIYDLCDEALSPFSKITPFNTPIASIQAKSLTLMKKNKDEIIAKYNEALEEIPYHVSTILDLYKLYMQYEDYTNAEKYINLAVEYAPSNIIIQLDYIIYLKSIGKKDKALVLLEKFDPNTRNKTYQALVAEFMGQKIIDEAKNIKAPRLISSLSEIIESRDKIVQIYKDSRLNNVSFEKQLYYQALIDAYGDKVYDKDFKPEIDSIIQKYNIQF